MNLEIESINDLKIVVVQGRLDTTNAGEFEQQMTEILNGGCTRLILDCTGLNYISSSGLRVFLVIQKKMKLVNGQFRLFGLQPSIREIFDIAGFSVILTILPDRDFALKSI